MSLSERASLESLLIIKPPVHCVPSDVAVIKIFITEDIKIFDRPVLLVRSQKRLMWLKPRVKKPRKQKPTVYHL